MFSPTPLSLSFSLSLSLFIHPIACLTTTALSLSPHITIWAGEEELTCLQTATDKSWKLCLKYSTWVNVLSCIPPLCNNKSLYFECENPKWGCWWRRRRAITLEHVQPLRAGGLIQDHRQSPPLWSQLTRAVLGEIHQSLAFSSTVFDFQRSIRAWTFFSTDQSFISNIVQDAQLFCHLNFFICPLIFERAAHSSNPGSLLTLKIKAIIWLVQPLSPVEFLWSYCIRLDHMIPPLGSKAFSTLRLSLAVTVKRCHIGFGEGDSLHFTVFFKSKSSIFVGRSRHAKKCSPMENLCRLMLLWNLTVSIIPAFKTPGYSELEA